MKNKICFFIVLQMSAKEIGFAQDGIAAIIIQLVVFMKYLPAYAKHQFAINLNVKKSADLIMIEYNYLF